MIHSALIQPLSHWWYLIVLVLLVTMLCSPRFKGDQGDFVISAPAPLLLVLAKKYHPLIKRVTLPTEVGIAQFDYDSVSKYMMFCVENKNMEGWSFRSVKRRYWTLTVSKQLQNFQQPLHKNLKNCTILQALLGLNDQKRRMV